MDRNRNEFQGKRGSRKYGFTLVEICVAIMVLGIGMVSVLSVYPLALRWAQDIKVSATAAQTARAVLDDSSFTTGTINGYYIERTGIASSDRIGSSGAKAGSYGEVVVKIFPNADTTDDKDIVFQLSAKLYEREQ